MSQLVNKELLKEYISSNEVVFQTFGGLMEVANDNEKENKETLLSYFDTPSNIGVFSKDHFFIKEDFQELNDWSLEDDVLFLLQPIGVLVCITKKEVIKNNLIAA